MEYPQEHIKPYGNDGKKSEQVEEMFDNIAPAYDKLNHTLSMGIDRSWRKKAIDTLRPFSPRRIMDVATGTGDFAILACRELQPDMLIGTDISEGMMNVGREKVKQAHLSDRISFAREDCTSLSFADESFDAVTVAFGIRNFDGLDKGLSEMCRVLVPGGHLVILELSTPDRFPDETTLYRLLQSRHPAARQVHFERQQRLHLSAPKHPRLSARRNHAGSNPQGRVQRGTLQAIDFRNMHLIHC